MARSRVPGASVQKTPSHRSEDPAATNVTAPFPFMRLPPELRDNVYEKVFDDLPEDYLTSRTHGRLACRSALPRVNRKIRSEFLPILFLRSREVVALVENSEFAHIVTFLICLSIQELETFRPKAEAPPCRNFTIELHNEYGISALVFKSLLRWFFDINNLAKKGVDIPFEYMVVQSEDSACSANLTVQIHLRSWRREVRVKGKVARELEKVVEAIEPTLK